MISYNQKPTLQMLLGWTVVGQGWAIWVAVDENSGRASDEASDSDSADLHC